MAVRMCMLCTYSASSAWTVLRSGVLCRAVQPALFVAGLAAVEKLRGENPEAVQACSATAGLSLGEYTALVFSGAMTFKDGLKVRVAVTVINDVVRILFTGFIWVLNHHLKEVK